MSVTVTVIEHIMDKKQIVVLAEQNGKKILKSTMKYTRFKKQDIEKLIRKGLKAYDTPLWGGMNIYFQIKMD